MLSAVSLLSGAPTAAQEPEGPLVRRGTVRLEFAPQTTWWDSRFGKRTEGGSTIEEVEPLGFDLTSDVVGTAMIPTLASFQDRLADALAEPGYVLDLGESRTTWTHSQTRLPVRLDVGVFDWLTVSGMVPFVRSQPVVDVSFRGDSASANAGRNPALSDPGGVNSFLSALSFDVGTLQNTVDQICGDLGSTDPSCVDGQALLAEGQSIESGLESLYRDEAAFLPLTGTDTGRTLEQRVGDFQTDLDGFGQSATAGAPPLSEQPLDDDGFNLLVTELAYGVAGAPLSSSVGVWEIGDVEVSAAVRLLESSRDPEHTGARYLLGAEALVRLATGVAPNLDVFQDLGSGDGQTDVEVRVFGSALAGRWGVLGHARLGIQQSALVDRRITTPDVILAPFASRATVSWSPGNTFDLYVAPRLLMAPGMALILPYQFYRKGEDSYTLPSGATGPPEGAPEGAPDVTVLNEETAIALHRLGVGVVFSTMDGFRQGKTSLPLELRAVYESTFSGSGGQTPKASRVRVTFRLFLSFWGDGA